MGAAPADYKDLIPVLIAGLGDTDGDVRESSAVALVGIGSSAVKPLLEVFNDAKKSADVRANAAYTLGQMGSSARDALGDLTKALKDKDSTTGEGRKRVAFAISRIVASDPFGFGPGFGDSRAPKMKATDPGLIVPEKTKK
jgi:HEAT repeat protein